MMLGPPTSHSTMWQPAGSPSRLYPASSVLPAQSVPWLPARFPARIVLRRRTADAAALKMPPPSPSPPAPVALSARVAAAAVSAPRV